MNVVVEPTEQVVSVRQSAEAALELAASLGKLGAWSLDLRDNTQVWSEQLYSLLEVSPGTPLTLNFGMTLVAPEHRAIVQAAVERCAKHGVPYDLQVQAVTARGRRVWVRLIGHAVYDQHGSIVRLHGAYQDISAMVRAHEDKRLLAERLNVTLESMTEGFYVVDQNWRVTYANSEAARVMRLSRNAAIGKHLWTELFPEAAGSIFQVEFERAVRTGSPVQLEEYYPPQDLWVFVRAYPSSFGLAVAFTDISTCRRAQEEARRLNAELEQRVLERTAALQAANQDLESFAHAVAHDLRTPMCAARSYAYALQATERSRLSAQALEDLEQIHASLQYMDDMTEKLLGLAKLSKSTIRCEPVDLSTIARSILDGHKDNEPWREVRFEVERGVTVFADRVLVTQVLQNLLGNAWKFTRDTAVARIAFGARTDAAGQLAVFVEDNGPGFDMPQAKRLFQPFAQLHTDETFKGSGIGLATVKKIISRHGGTIWAEAVRGTGACFSFTLPPQNVAPARQQTTRLPAADDALLKRARACLEQFSRTSTGDDEIHVGLCAADGAMHARSVLRSWDDLARCTADLVGLGFSARARTSHDRAEGFAAVFTPNPELLLITRPSNLSSE